MFVALKPSFKNIEDVIKVFVNETMKLFFSFKTKKEKVFLQKKIWKFKIKMVGHVFV